MHRPGPIAVFDGKITWKNFSDANITMSNLQKKEHGAAALDWVSRLPVAGRIY
jgi:hypothetical protein